MDTQQESIHCTIDEVFFYFGEYKQKTLHQKPNNISGQQRELTVATYVCVSDITQSCSGASAPNREEFTKKFPVGV